MLIEPIVLNYLKENLNVPVHIEMPDSLPKTFVLFEVIDRGRKNFIDQVTIEFHSYAECKMDAALLDEKVRMLMEDIIFLPEISASKFGGGNDSNDTSVDKYRYRCYFNLTYMGG